MTITLIAAGIMGLWHLALSWNVVSYRRKSATVDGNSADDPSSMLYRSIRAHGNNAEYTPLLLILLALVEYGGAINYAVMVLAAMIVLGRLMHGIGMGYTDGSVMFYRVAGTVLTWTSLLTGSLGTLILAFNIL